MSHNYVSLDKSICVINDSARFDCEGNLYSTSSNDDDKQKIIKECQLIITAMFKAELGSKFTFKEKKRASVTPVLLTSTLAESSNTNMVSSAISLVSTSSTLSQRSMLSNHANRKKRKARKLRKNNSKKIAKEKICDPDILPTISLGWSTQNCHEYAKNKCTTAGNVRPSLRDGHLSTSCKKLLLQCVQKVLKAIPSKHCFNLDVETDDVVSELRKSMIGQFQSLLGGSSEYDGSFRVEGITMTIPSAIGFHRDSLNCNREGMRSVVSVNVNVPINDETVPALSKLRLWLEENGYNSSFPLSIILYSRKMVSFHCLKQSKSIVLSNKNKLYSLIHWVLTDRVGSEIDYESSVWCNPKFGKDFMTLATVRESSRFNGRMYLTTETLDKIVSSQSFNCFFPILKKTNLHSI